MRLNELLLAGQLLLQSDLSNFRILLDLIVAKLALLVELLLAFGPLGVQSLGVLLRGLLSKRGVTSFGCGPLRCEGALVTQLLLVLDLSFLYQATMAVRVLEQALVQLHAWALPHHLAVNRRAHGRRTPTTVDFRLKRALLCLLDVSDLLHLSLMEDALLPIFVETLV